MMNPARSRLLALALFGTAASVQADLITYSGLSAFDASSTTALVEDFEARGVYGRDQLLPTLSHAGISYTPHAGVNHPGQPFPNVWVASPGYPNFGVPTTTTSILTANGDEDFTLSFAAPGTAVGFDTYLNAYGPATIRVYGSSGLLGTFTQAHAANQVGFFGVISDDEAITSIRFTSVHGGLINTGIDNIRMGVYDAPGQTPAAVPEPSTWAIFGLGALLALGFRQKAALRA